MSKPKPVDLTRFEPYRHRLRAALLPPGVHVPAEVAAELWGAVVYALQRSGKQPTEQLRAVLADLERAAMWHRNTTRSTTGTDACVSDDPAAGWLTVTEAAAKLNVSDRAIRGRIQRKTIEARRIGGRWMVRLST